MSKKIKSKKEKNKKTLFVPLIHFGILGSQSLLAPQVSELLPSR